MLMVFKILSPNVKVICVGRGPPLSRHTARLWRMHGGGRAREGRGAGALYLAQGGKPRARGPESYLYYTLWVKVARFGMGFICGGLGWDLYTEAQTSYPFSRGEAIWRRGKQNDHTCPLDWLDVRWFFCIWRCRAGIRTEFQVIIARGPEIFTGEPSEIDVNRRCYLITGGLWNSGYY